MVSESGRGWGVPLSLWSAAATAAARAQRAQGQASPGRGCWWWCCCCLFVSTVHLVCVVLCWGVGPGRAERRHSCSGASVDAVAPPTPAFPCVRAADPACCAPRRCRCPGLAGHLRFWKCPNGDECKYRHALPPNYVLKSQMKELLEEASGWLGPG